MASVASMETSLLQATHTLTVSDDSRPQARATSGACARRKTSFRRVKTTRAIIDRPQQNDEDGIQATGLLVDDSGVCDPGQFT